MHTKTALALIPALALVAACATSHRAEPAPVEVPVPVAVVDSGVPAEPAVVEAVEAVVDEAPAEQGGLDPTVADKPLITFQLRRGETLAHFARWSELPIETIAAASGLSPLDDQLPVGTPIKVPLDEDARAKVEAARDDHRFRRAEGWLAAHGGEVGTEFYQVRTGDSAWTIAREHGQMPVWVIESYNPSLDLEALRPGQQLMLPLVASR
ncbi:MAG: LysM domain-containing protein [Myxococcota bacterium]